MDTQMFVDAIREVVVEDSIKALQETLIKPPGRKPAQEQVELSEWFNALKSEDKDMVQRLVKQSVELTAFGFFCVLDGVRNIENTELKGQLKLIYEKNNEIILLNDPKNDFMHDCCKFLNVS